MTGQGFRVGLKKTATFYKKDDQGNLQKVPTKDVPKDVQKEMKRFQKGLAKGFMTVGHPWIYKE